MKYFTQSTLVFLFLTFQLNAQHELVPSDVTIVQGVITNYNNTTEANIIIPESIGGETIIGIGPNAFKNGKTLTDVQFNGSSLEYIGEAAFESNDIVNLDFSGASNLDSIASRGFYGSQIAGNLALPPGLKIIESEAFRNNNITGITHNGGSDLVIGPDAFHQNSFVTLTIPSSVVFIGDSAFRSSRNNSTTTVAFEANSNLITIDDEAFSYNANLSAVAIPKTVEYIGYRAFYASSNSSLTDLSFEAGGTETLTIGIDAFRLSKIVTLNLPSRVVELDNYAFSQDVNTIVSINFESGSSLKYIRDHVFNGCNVSTVTIPNSVSSIGYRGFYSNDDLEEIIFESNSQLDTIGADAFRQGGTFTSPTVSLPSSVRDVGANAFRDNDITTIQLGSPSMVYGGAYLWQAGSGDIDISEGSDVTELNRSYSAYIISDFMADVDEIEVDETVSFSSLSQITPTSISWDFGDGSPLSSELNPSHIYSQVGLFTVSCTVSYEGNDYTETKTNYITVNATLTVEEDVSETFKMYPNPVEHHLFLEANDNGQIEIYSITGALVRREIINKGGNEFDLRNISKGVYLVKIQIVNGGYETQKLIIQ